MTNKTKMKPVELTKMIGKVEDLPTLPMIVLKITESVNNPQSSAKDLAKIITEDQVLTARLLKLVNSAFYGFPQRISTVTGAIVLLGFDAIRNLLLTTSIFDMFTNKKQKVQLENLWEHSLGCAVGAKIIGSYMKYEEIEELFVAGLLHDIGKIVEAISLPKEFTETLSLVKADNILLVNAEDQILGHTHAEVGKLLAEKWNLPPKLVNPIACHHNPDAAEDFLEEASVVHLADILSRALNIGSGGDNRIPPLNSLAWDALRLKIGDIEMIMENMTREFEDISLFVT